MSEVKLPRMTIDPALVLLGQRRKTINIRDRHIEGRMKTAPISAAVDAVLSRKLYASARAGGE